MLAFHLLDFTSHNLWGAELHQFAEFACLNIEMSALNPSSYSKHQNEIKVCLHTAICHGRFDSYCGVYEMESALK